MALHVTMSAPVSQTIYAVALPLAKGQDESAREILFADTNVRASIKEGRKLAGEQGKKLELLKIEQMIWVHSPIWPED